MYTRLHTQKKLKLNLSESNEEGTAKNLSFDDVSELIFETLGFQFEDCIGVDYYTGRYDTREVHLKSNVDPSKYITREPVVFMNHEVTVSKMITDVVKVVFKNVPLYVPDEEILHLCGYYGNVVDNKVHKEQLRIVTSKKNGLLLSPTRYVLMNLDCGASFRNYYWLEGPMANDGGRRITVLHAGQAQQCSNCLLTVSSGCNGAGNGKACAAIGTPRAKMNVYMQALKVETGYESLKTKYLRQVSKQQLQEVSKVLTDEVNLETFEEDNSEDTVEGEASTPIDKDLEIAELKKQISHMQEEVASIPVLQKEIEEATHEKSLALAVTKQLSRRLSVSGRANVQKMVGLIQTGSNWSEDSAHLACSHAATLDDDEFELDEETDQVKPKNPSWNFLLKVEKFLDMNDTLQQERLAELRNMILDQMKTTIKKKKELRGEKRASDLDLTPNLQSKPRFVSPPKN